MFAITLLHIGGGQKIVLGETLAECRKKCYTVSSKDPDSYLCATIPYAAWQTSKDVYDTSIPFDIKKSLGLEIRLTLSPSE